MKRLPPPLVRRALLAPLVAGLDVLILALAPVLLLIAVLLFPSAGRGRCG